MNIIKRLYSVQVTNKITYIKGAHSKKSTTEVELRGLKISGNYSDLPALIFFPQVFDTVESWLPFFLNKKILSKRDIYLLYPRNFGNSDLNDSFVSSEMAADVERFMYQNKISTTTIGGHGLGAKLALAFACYNSAKTTGFFGFDYSPLDYRPFAVYQRLWNYIEALHKIDLKLGLKKVYQLIDKIVPEKEWNEVFKKCVKSRSGQLEWAFNMEAVKKSFGYHDFLGNFPSNIGLYPGRSTFMFPDYSEWVYLGTNTLPMYSKCPQLRGLGDDIFAMPSSEEDIVKNHFMYNNSELTFILQSKLFDFINLKDGVHLGLMDRNDIGNDFIPELTSFNDLGEHGYSNISPLHFHHNFKFQK